MPRLFSKSVIFLLVLLLIATTGNAETEIEKKRREILARRAHQRMQVNAMIRHLRQEQADHSSGKKVLDPKEKEELERRLNLYVMKVDSIKDYVDDEEVETTIAREESQRRYRSRTIEELELIQRQTKESEPQPKRDATRGEEL